MPKISEPNLIALPLITQTSDSVAMEIEKPEHPKGPYANCSTKLVQ